jgi:hypothetical protein
VILGSFVCQVQQCYDSIDLFISQMCWCQISSRRSTIVTQTKIIILVNIRPSAPDVGTFTEGGDGVVGEGTTIGFLVAVFISVLLLLALMLDGAALGVLDVSVSFLIVDIGATVIFFNDDAVGALVTANVALLEHTKVDVTVVQIRINQAVCAIERRSGATFTISSIEMDALG